tara:strand:- start:6440 stop:6820 length:381 start_codon:yes stop_codon:yes gene_type:complete
MSDGTVEGKVHFIDTTKTFGTKGFRKRTVVLEQDSGNFTNYIPVEFIQDACDSVDGMLMGDQVAITFVLTGRKWQKDAGSELRYFLNAQASSWRSLTGAAPPKETQQQLSEPASAPEGFNEDDVQF